MKVTLRQIIGLQKELEEKQAELGEMIKSYEGQWQQKEAEFPQIGDDYYFIDEEGCIGSSFYADECDMNSYKIGNCFSTKEEAEFAVEQLKVIAEIKKCGGVWKTKQGAEKEYALLCNTDNVVVSFSFTEGCYPDIWFSTEAQAQKALETIGQERLMKYWFNVEV